jgi:ABC-type branched-subunit amino acid transport system substrate-binding protein
MVRVRSAIAVLLAAALVMAACSSDKKTTATTASSSSSNAPLTASFRGVTATTIKIGVAVVDFKCIAQFVDFTQGDALKIVQALVDDVNKNGGILGRKIEIVFKNLCPLQPTSVAAACTAFTDDDQVFAVMGVYDTPPSDGSNQLCLAKDKDTVLINELTTKKVVDQATPGLLLTPNILPDRRLDALLSVLKQKKTLAGKKVAVLADQDTASFETAVKAAASGLGASVGSTAVLTITNEDTSAAQAQLDTFIERWRTEGTNALVMGGLLVSAKQFVEKIKAALPNMLLLTTDSNVGDQAKDEKKAGKTPNPYDGMLSLSGLSDSETFKSEGVQRCVKIYETATGEKVLGPDELKPDATGKRIEVYIGIQDRCNELAILIAVATKAGANLTNDTWIAAVNTLGKFKTATATIASLKQGKYDAEDGFRLGAWDSSIQPDGDFKPDSPQLLDVSA